ncbi:Zn-dependent peptidase ImmA (M78 family) [Chitinophaga skermanii]|uniref:Zn-dependent peptidase ImmA (M78 family) n=1 Tax=Chitinophaga skermanii TaxID=331697 RepID=A0A327R4S7_9BACT|nr:XRE family transcriptional regulator [Chitinophaga skermanii]RAJ11078.1 Zn-dependent peptidase ImmA (M78 family) [Chitinophaga skermanii]
MILNPKQIVLARNMRGLSQGELSKRLGHANQSTLSNVEKEKLPFTEELANQLAEVLCIPIAFFSKEKSFTRLSKFYYRKRNAFPASELVPLESKMEIIRSGYEELLNSVDINIKKLPAIPVKGNNSPEAIANSFRLFLGLNDDPIDNLVTMVEKLGITVLFLDVNSDKFSGLTLQTDINAPLIVLNKNMPNDHKKFTIAHELGHLIMHIPFAEDPEFYEDLEDLDAVEQQADSFAGAFLMPKKKAQYTFANLTYSRLTELKLYWKVSKQAIIYRAKEIGAINANKFKFLFIELSRFGERKKENIEIAIDMPVLFKRIISVYENELKYSRKAISEDILGISEQDFNIWFDFNERPRLRVVLD